jgi:hypothetical protein
LCHKTFVHMELIGKIALMLHVVAGISTLITGPIAIFYNFKDPQKHRLVGKLFFYAMLVVIASSVGGFIKRPHEPFYQFLFGLSILVLCGILRGVRSIFMMKGGAIRPLDWGYTWLLGINGLWMLGMGFYGFNAGGNIAIPILFTVFGMMSFSDVRQNWKVFRQPELMHRLDWMRLHAGTMLGAFTASTTAFTVNVAHALPWWIQWFGPTLLLLPLQFYFGGTLKSMKKKAVGL